MRALDQPATDARDDGLLHVALELEVDRRRAAGDGLVLDLEVLGAAELIGGLADEHDHVTGILERRGAVLAHIVEQTDQADRGRGIDRRAEASL